MKGVWPPADGSWEGVVYPGIVDYQLPPWLVEFWHYRELFFFLVWRDVKIRYKQTLLGAAWAVIQPFFTMLVFTLFFGKLAKIARRSLPTQPPSPTPQKDAGHPGLLRFQAPEPAQAHQEAPGRRERTACQDQRDHRPDRRGRHGGGREPQWGEW